MSATLKKLVGMQYNFKLELQSFLTATLADQLVAPYNTGANTPAARDSLLASFIGCGPSMGFEAKKFAYGVLELIVDALVNSASVPDNPWNPILNDQLVNITRYVGIAGEEDFHFMVAVYNLSATLSQILQITPIGGIATLTLGSGGSGYTVDGADGNETAVVFLAKLPLADQSEPDQYADAVVEATIVGGVVTAVTAITDSGSGFSVNDVANLEIDTSVAGQEDATGSGATVTVLTIA